MKIIHYLFLCLCPILMYSQNADSQSIEGLKKQKETIIEKEKEALKKEVESINLRWEQNEISEREASELKRSAAEKRAANIENELAIIDNRIALLERNKEDAVENKSLSQKESKLEDTVSTTQKVTMRIGRKRHSKRTVSGPVIAFGLNNLITEGESFDHSQFKVGGSRFFEVGWAWKTRVFPEQNWFRIKYGLSFQFNGLKPVDNLFFTTSGEQTELQVFPHPLSKSKFRMDNLVLPLHFEFGSYELRESSSGKTYSKEGKFRVGVGGYAGVNLGTRQKLKFKENGSNRKQKLKEDYNTANMIYGISGYIGWSSFSLYAKYDLNPIFRNNAVDQRNISIGLRFD